MSTNLASFATLGRLACRARTGQEMLAERISDHQVEA